MMVITTNHFNKLDPALIRPGRVDTCLELKRCKPEAVLGIFNICYGDENLPDNFDINKVFYINISNFVKLHLPYVAGTR
jgi:ATP-dependent 26S proteasome regulatory subunit